MLVSRRGVRDPCEDDSRRGGAERALVGALRAAPAFIIAAEMNRH